MEDEWIISDRLSVPDNIAKPHYVGRRDQIFPTMCERIKIHNQNEIKLLKSASNSAARTLKHALDSTEVGMSLDEIDKIVHEYIVADGAYPSTFDFLHFPKSVCLSVNDVVSHGVPNNYVLKAGDYLNIYVVCFKDGFHGDNSAMKFIEDGKTKVHDDIKRLSRVTRETMFKSIEYCRPGVKFSKIGQVIEEYAHRHGYTVNYDFDGRGIGKDLNMSPKIH